MDPLCAQQCEISTRTGNRKRFPVCLQWQAHNMGPCTRSRAHMFANANQRGHCMKGHMGPSRFRASRWSYYGFLFSCALWCFPRRSCVFLAFWWFKYSSMRFSTCEKCKKLKTYMAASQLPGVRFSQVQGRIKDYLSQQKVRKHTS